MYVAFLNIFNVVYDSITERFLCKPGPYTKLFERFFYRLIKNNCNFFIHLFKFKELKFQLKILKIKSKIIILSTSENKLR